MQVEDASPTPRSQLPRYGTYIVNQNLDGFQRGPNATTNIELQACALLISYISETKGYTSLKIYNPVIQLRNSVKPNTLSCYYF